MRLPPRWVRRVVLAPAVVLVTVVVLTTLPVWMLLAAALSPLLPGRLRALRVLWVVVVALVLESLVLVVLLGFWLAAGFGLALRTPRFQYLHYWLVGWYLRVLYREAARVLRLRVDVEGPDPDDYLDRPLLVFCRHAGPGDSFLLVHALVNWYARERGSCCPRLCNGTRRSTWCSTGCPTGSCPAGVARSSNGGSASSRRPSTTTTPS